jgi:hypothetical protein
VSRPILASLGAGLAIVTLGVLLLLEAEGTISLGGWLGAVLAACGGTALVASGVGARD